jgi:hypothetical protein
MACEKLRSICDAALILALLVCLSPPSVAHAAEIVVDSAQVGGYYGDYLPSDDPPPPADVPAPDISIDDQVYFMGRSTIGGVTLSERRVYFLFDLSGVSIPAGEDVVDVFIDLALLAGGTSALANFSGGAEFIKFTSTSFTAEEILDPGLLLPPDDIITVFESFGTGTPYGGLELLSGGSPPGIYEIPLTDAVPDVIAAIDAGSTLVVTARLFTFDPDPIGPVVGSPIDPYEYVFGGTDIASSTGPSTVPPVPLTIETAVPEPASIALLGLGSLIMHRRRR